MSYEEIDLIPSHTIYFTGYNLRCAYCTNQDCLNHTDTGEYVNPVNMYASSEIMPVIDAITDIYLADFKFGSHDCAEKIAGAVEKV